MIEKSTRYLELISFANFFDSQIFSKKFNKVLEKSGEKSKHLQIIMTEYGFDSNITGCQLFESETSENQAFGVSHSELEEKFYGKKEVSEAESKVRPNANSPGEKLKITNQVIGVSTWSGDLHLRLLLNQKPYISTQLGFNLKSENRFCGGCTDFDFAQDFLSSESGTVKVVSCYGNGIVKLWALGSL